MIVLEKPTITDLFIPRTGGAEGAIKKGCFNRKDIMTLLSDYITVESATTILDQIFLDYIEGDNNLTELILNAVGDVYTKEQIDVIVEILQGQINDFATEDWVENQGYLTGITITINGTDVHNGDSITIEGGSGSTDPSVLENYYTKEETNELLADKADDIELEELKEDYNDFKEEMESCCSSVTDTIQYLLWKIEDLQAQIDAIDGGDTPTPTPTPTPGSGGIMIGYNVTSTTIPTKIMNSQFVNNDKIKVYYEGNEIIKSTGYTFSTIDTHYLTYVFENTGGIAPIHNLPGMFTYIDSIVSVEDLGGYYLIQGAAFDHCANLEIFEGADDVTHFYGPDSCDSLDTVVVPSSTTKISGFCYCPNLSGITLPEGLEEIYNHTLKNAQMESLVIPGTVTSIGTDFLNNTSLESLTIEAVVPPTLGSETTSLGKTSLTFPIYVPEESVQAYKSNSQYQWYAYRIEGYTTNP